MPPADPYVVSQFSEPYAEIPAEEVPQEPYYESPQAQSMDQLLAQAESSVAPAILASLLAAYAALEGTRATFSGLNSGVTFAADMAAETLEAFAKIALFIFKRDNAARLQMLKHELLPFAVRAAANLLRYAPPQQRVNLMNSGADPYNVAEQAVNDTIDRVFGSMDQSVSKTRDYVNDKDFHEDTGLFDTLSAVFSGESDPRELKPFTMKGRTKEESPNDVTKRNLENAARRFARLLVRDAAFRAQEKIAKEYGFTHKRWVTSLDDRVRALHLGRHGIALPISDKFQGPDGGIGWPGDPSASLNETANCRCSLEWIKR